MARQRHHDELRTQVVRLLRGDGAHAPYAEVLGAFPARWAGQRIPAVPHTAWRLLEHLRIAQWDILEWTRDAAHESPDFPRGYWPDTEAPPSARAWKQSIAAFLADLEAMIALVEDPATDPTAAIPHTDGVSLLREALLLADHNSYHLGQLVLVQRTLQAAAKARRRQPARSQRQSSRGVAGFPYRRMPTRKTRAAK